MKRFFSIITILALLSTVLFTGCGEIDRYEELSQLLESNKDNLSSTFTEDTCEYDMLSEYLSSWAKGSKIDVDFSGNHSTVLSCPATEGNEKASETALLCNVKTDDIQSSIEVLATAETALLGPEEHGKITLIVTEIKSGHFLGIEELPEKYLDEDNLINLQSSSTNTILVSGARNASCSFIEKGKPESPDYTEALEISFTMPEYTDPYDFVKNNNYPNPITTIGSLLANAKSSGKLFEIASFTCKSHEGYTPYSATAVVVVDSNAVESFNKKFDNSFENISEKFEKLEADYVYTISETDLPKTVLSDDVSDNLISLMYTLNTGICLQDEDTGVIYTASYIDNIDTKNGDLCLSADIRARGESYLDNISSEYETTAGLCDTKYNCKNNGFVWHSDQDSDLVCFFTEAVPLTDGESNISLRTYENDYISKINPDLNMIIYTFDTADTNNVLNNIAHFLNTDEK